MVKKLLIVGAAAVSIATVAVEAYGGTAGAPIMGKPSRISQPAFHGYYDGHKDTYLSTDVSNRAEARAMHINYSGLISIKGLPEIYLVQGRAATGQLAIFG